MVAADYPLHALFEFGGTLEEVSAGDEIWACGIRGFFGHGGPGTMTTWPSLDLDATLAAQYTNLLAWFGSVGAAMAGTAYLRWAKLNVIGSDGKYADKTTTHVIDSSSVNGAAAATMPSYMSLAYSWETERKRGLAARGRIYPPNFTMSFTGSAVTSAETTTAVTSGKTLLTALNVSDGLDGGVFTPAICSSQDAAWAEINGVRVGNIIDVQRRRRNAVAEVYASSVWP